MKLKMKMKKSFAVLLCVVMLFVMLPMQIFSAEESGVPTLNDDGYYEIYNSDQLYWFAGLVNGTLTDGTAQNVSANAILMNDTTVNKNVLNSDGEPNSGTFTEWTPIGWYNSTSDNAPYKGTFDGNNYTVSGLYYNNYSTSSPKYVGMFGFAKGVSSTKKAVIKNLTVADSYIAGAWWVGGIVGDANANMTINNCVNKASVKGYQYVGGITGGTENTIAVENCRNEGKVNGAHIVGGLMGVTDYNTTVTNCVNTGDVYFIQTNSPTIGGFIGRIYRNSVVSNCYNTGDFIVSYTFGKYTNTAGGFAGTIASTSTVKNCYFSGQMSIAGINASGKTTIGSFCGTTSGTVENCYYNSELSSEYPAAGYFSSSEEPIIKGVSASQLASGEVTYLLNGSVNNSTFKQTLGTDSTPNFTGAVVYKMGSYYTNRYYEAADLVTLRKLILGFGVTMDFSDVNADKTVDIADLVRLKKILASIA